MSREIGGTDDLHPVHEIGAGALCGKSVERFRIVCSGKERGAPPGRHFEKKHIPHEISELLQNARGILSVLPESIEQGERPLRCVGCDSFEELLYAAASGKTQGAAYGFRIDMFAGGALIEQGECVAHSSVCETCQERCGLCGEVDILL